MSIIAIAGLKNSGKTTAADMANYILNTPKLFNTYFWYKLLKKWRFKKKWHTVAFADPLKKSLSIILNKPLKWFDDRDHKENYFVSLNSLQIYPRWLLGEDSILPENKFSKIIKSGEGIPEDYCLSIRQLMQYYGTNIVRKYLGDKTWINATLNSSKDKNIIISDLRFKTEYQEIKKQNGITIYIIRDGAVPGSHTSEREVVELDEQKAFDYTIPNDGTLEDLFYNLKEILNECKRNNN